jgi:hypothetical protein
MYQEHVIFEHLEANASLWRYMDFTRFVSLIDKHALFFARADRLGDHFEGSVSKMNLELRPQWYEGYLDKVIDQMVPFRRMLPSLTLVNCWHASEHESAAMWRLYAREHDGIVVRTTFEALCKSLTCDEPVHIGKVKYVDYERDVISEGDTFSPFLHKREEFEHEHEVRAVHQRLSLIGSEQWADIYTDAYGEGEYLTADLATLIKEIIVAPFAPRWFLDLVSSVTDRYGVPVHVAQSKLSGLPHY